MHNHDGIQIYITGPLFNTHERWYLEHIAAAHEAAGYCTFLPHRDAGLLGQVTLERRLTLFYDDLAALERSDLVVALLTGPDQDTEHFVHEPRCLFKRHPTPQTHQTLMQKWRQLSRQQS